MQDKLQKEQRLGNGLILTLLPCWYKKTYPNDSSGICASDFEAHYARLKAGKQPVNLDVHTSLVTYLKQPVHAKLPGKSTHIRLSVLAADTHWQPKQEGGISSLPCTRYTSMCLAIMVSRTRSKHQPPLHVAPACAVANASAQGTWEWYLQCTLYAMRNTLN